MGVKGTKTKKEKKNLINHFGVTQFNGRTVETYIRAPFLTTRRSEHGYSRADLHTLHNRGRLALFVLEKEASLSLSWGRCT